MTLPGAEALNRKRRNPARGAVPEGGVSAG